MGGYITQIDDELLLCHILLVRPHLASSEKSHLSTTRGRPHLASSGKSHLSTSRGRPHLSISAFQKFLVVSSEWKSHLSTSWNESGDCRWFRILQLAVD